jgi:hypothetical protein
MIRPNRYLLRLLKNEKLQDQTNQTGQSQINDTEEKTEDEHRDQDNDGGIYRVLPGGPRNLLQLDSYFPQKLSDCVYFVHFSLP